MRNHLITIKPRISPDTRKSAQIPEATIRRSDDQGERGIPAGRARIPAPLTVDTESSRAERGRAMRDKDIDSLSFSRTPEPCYQIAITCAVIWCGFK
ncbi:hypothetical protein RRG08_004897 [Elysia crispata]|uniref:Uncharacterized protein n=1 Tax=Elysia crispata TaxID=231223 RepID=A0AAE0ZI42_9GAST|nr:hypothetical protein RRG08_004897 [Elysia crispata]